MEPQEASALLHFIELLFEEWYIHRHEREQKLKAISGIAKKKEELRKTKKGLEGD